MISSPKIYRPEPRFIWPEKKRCAAMICFDVDGETTALSEDVALESRVSTMSQLRYGPTIAVPRILGLLESLEIKATFFIPTYIVEKYPRTCTSILEKSHEIGLHGHLHEKLSGLNPDEEETLLDKTLDIMSNVLGIVPRGFRAPWFEINPGTVDLLASRGLDYNASLMDDDVPYLHKNGLVEIPGQWMLEDWEQFAFNADPAWGFIPEDCDKVFNLWWQEFDAMLDYGCCFNLTLHPWLSGRPSRIKLLERLISAMQATESVWFATGSEIADYISNNPAARRELCLEGPAK